MRASQRYEITSPFTEIDRETVASGDWFPADEDKTVLVIRVVANIRDTVTNDSYAAGAYRVRSFKDGRPFRSMKTFYGELAWADSQRMFDDIVSEVRFAR